MLANNRKGVYNINKRNITPPQEKYMIHDIKRFAGQDIVTRRYINDLNKRAYKKQVVKSIAGVVATAIAVILITDMIGFFGWAMSGQRPVDNFYLGSITTHTLQAVIK